MNLHNYIGFVIVERLDGVHLIDPVSGNYQALPSVRSAKWTASVYSRVRRGFTHQETKEMK
jgi:hypothetical protein